MTFIGILLMLIGIVGFVLGSMMVGDIGIAAIIGAASAFISGIGFLMASRKIKKYRKED